MKKSHLSKDADAKDLRRQTNPDLFTLAEASDILAREGFKPVAGSVIRGDYASVESWLNSETGIVALLYYIGDNDTYIFRRMGHMDEIGPREEAR